MFRSNAILWLAAAFLLIGCGKREFAVKGLVEEVQDGGKVLRVRHEAIPNYMQAMTMDFRVKNPSETAALKPGDAIAFKMVVTQDEGWIEQVTKISPDQVAVAAPGPVADAPRNLDPLQPGALIPNYSFTNELGRPIQLKDLRGNAVALTFIFTRCPFPEACPRMSNNFAEAYRFLKNRPETPSNWKLISVTFDPEYDTPAVLKEYAAKYHYDPATWSFVTGPPEEIGALAAQVDLKYAREGGTIPHNFRTVVIDRSGKLQKIFQGNQWTSTELAEELIRAAR